MRAAAAAGAEEWRVRRVAVADYYVLNILALFEHAVGHPAEYIHSAAQRVVANTHVKTGEAISH